MPKHRFPGVTAGVTLVIAALAASACGQALASRPVLQNLKISQIVASAKNLGTTGVELHYYLPGTSIATNGGPWPYYKGFFNFHTGNGSLTIPDPSASHIFPVSWKVDQTGSIMTTTQPQPFTEVQATPGSSVPQPAHPASNGSITAIPGKPFSERILFSRIAAAGKLDPVETYEAIVVNPAFWLGLLASTSTSLGTAARTFMNGKPANSYDVIFNLADRPGNTNHAQQAAIKWLVGYFGTGRMPGEIWLSKSGGLLGARFIRMSPSSPLPQTASRFPDPAIYPTITLTLLGPSIETNTTSTSTTGSTGSLNGTTRTSTGTSPVGESVVTLGRAGGPRPRCMPAGHSGLSAAVVAHARQHITGYINASGCDVGVYVRTGTKGVVISHATITGANAHAIMVVDTSGTIVEDNTVTDNFGNAIDLTLLPENKTIELVGTTGARVTGNTGTPSIAVIDNGRVNAAAVNPGKPSPAVRNLVQGNHFFSWMHNSMNCLVAVTAFNPGEGVTGNIISDNTFSGGIVVATNAAHTAAIGNVVSGNTLTGASLPGIIVHSNSPGDIIKGTVIASNHLSHNAAMPICGLSMPAGIAIIGAATPILGTLVHGNTVSNEQVGIWMAGSTGAILSGNSISTFHGGMPVMRLMRPGCST
ncbi:MAG: right-handed parallel beta-helix repeat-containing protein [Actinobacteria bacterium]|nr:right-handed parallel beta-helix repeat-containing protein [Actinomycetota bacterium]